MSERGPHTVVGVVHIRLAIVAETLKEKRSVVKPVVERLRGRFNAAVAEVSDLDTPGYATIAAVVVSNERAHADSQLQVIARMVEESRLDAEVVDVSTELISL